MEGNLEPDLLSTLTTSLNHCCDCACYAHGQEHGGNDEEENRNAFLSISISDSTFFPLRKVFNPFL